MANSNHMIKIHPNSFYANLYSVNHFRMIGLIDVSIEYPYGVERVTLGFYSSSGTNSGKIKGLWYPILGIKTQTGPFIEFTPYLNSILTQTTRHGSAKKGWLAKSLFFHYNHLGSSKLVGFTNGRYYGSLLKVGETLRDLYEHGKFHNLPALGPVYLNSALTSDEIYPGNIHTQRENFERFIYDIFNESITQ